MWRLIQDFFRQNWIMRGAIAFGWLSVLIMVTSAYVSIDDLMTTSQGEGREGRESRESLEDHGAQLAAEDSVIE